MARAFEDDPAFRWVIPDDRKRLGALNVLFGSLLRRTLPIDFYETYTTPDVAGLALWARPGAWRLPTMLMLPTVPKLLRAFGLGATLRMARMMQRLEKAHPHEPHWYLAGLGTDPPHQRTGVGSALVRPVLDRCDRERLPAYLETQRADNVPYYERFGFRVTGELDIVEGGPHMWLMWRDPL